MGASSSGLLDEAKINHVKGLVDSIFHSFSELYRQQYSSAYLGHIHQEVEPKKEGRGLLLTHRPQYGPEEVLYQGSVKFSCWDEQGKKCRERYAVLRRDYTVEIHENKETFNRGYVAKLVLQPAGGVVLTEEEESRAHLEKKCAGILNGVKDDSSSVVPSPDEFAVYLHLPYTGHTCFLFQQEEERGHFLSALRTCIRHRNLDPWCEFSYENQAYVRALQIYQQDKGSYNTWEILLGTEEEVLASQVMNEVLPWLQSQLQSRVKGKKSERIRQWFTTVQATYMLVLDLLTANLEALREKCRQTASANQALIRSNLDQIMSSHCFLEQKVRACICEEAEKVYSEAIAPYMSSILEVLTENISAGIQGMRQTLHTQMDSAFKATTGCSEETKKALLTLRSISLDHCYTQVTNQAEILVNLKERFGLNSVDRLVHSAHLEMEQLLDSAVYTLELFLQSSVKLEPSQIPVKMERAKERVLKQLDYDSRLVQRRLYQEALLEITLPGLTRRMESKRQNELQQFEQYIFSDYSSFILVHNVFDDVLRDILSKEIETVVQDAASQKSNNLLLDISDLAISQYSLLGQTPPHSVPDSPAIQARDSSSAGPGHETAPVPEEGDLTVAAQCQSDPELQTDPSTTPTAPVLLSPLIIITQEFDESARQDDSDVEEICDTTPTAQSATVELHSLATSDSNKAAANEAEITDTTTVPESMNPSPDSPEPAASALSSSPFTAFVTEPAQGDQSAMLENSAAPVQIPADIHSNPPSCASPSHPLTDSPVIISLTLLNEAAVSVPQRTQQSTDRAVYLVGSLKDNWEVEKAKEEQQKEAGENEEKGNRLERQNEDEEKAEEIGDDARKGEEEHKEEEVPLQKPEPQESQDSSELPFDSVNIIRDLVTEIIEVETVVSSNSSDTL
ncbi:protein Niban-like [Echeneis naucrates]|uniref:Protein Niban-like n=1 Tax=Echeneis naucrates TaxID=173247 RepID=A0A665W839_ECHNA|nr:protein Niban-like [Echeneis naucrates]